MSWLRAKVSNGLAIDGRCNTDRQDTILLTRRRHHRGCANHDEVLHAVQSVARVLGLTVVVVDDSNMTDLGSVNDQLCRFRHAAAVVGPHGANHINLVASVPGTCFVEFIAPRTYIGSFQGFARKQGLRYVGINMSVSSSEELQAGNATVNASTVAQMLRRCLLSHVV